ncbi:MAG: hypothetical protein IPM69_02240 [Ignavibacteria bacterium]|nr:hypothetical protein [Ignavibacteria bacterium]
MNEDVKYIGDVTGDGIGDVAYGCASNGDFRIFKGIDWRKLSVETEALKADFTLKQTEPNPMGKDNKAILPATIARTGIYTLEVFDLTGKRIGELFKGELPVGEVRIPFDVKALNISSGMFTLRLSDGKRTQERAFVINR